jgi:GNAT superfamily N-acetyltransferase
VPTRLQRVSFGRSDIPPREGKAIVEIQDLSAAALDEAARIVTDALVDDPGWVAIGPGRRRHRWAIARRYHRAALGVMDRHGGPIYGAFRDGELAGVAATFAPALYPPPQRTFLRYVPAFAMAGPAPIVRGLRTSAIQERGHPDEEHSFLWFLGVDPRHQRGGLGRALVARVAEDSDAPVYLDTANPANVPYYAGLGFEELGSAPLPRGARMWFMVRPL